MTAMWKCDGVQCGWHWRDHAGCYRTIQDSHTGRLGDTLVDCVDLNELIEPIEEEGYASEPEFPPDPPWHLSLNAGNYITCKADLAIFSPPQPYQSRTFTILKSYVQYNGQEAFRKSDGFMKTSAYRLDG